MRLNNAPILDQLEGHWQRILLLVLHKLTKPGEEIVITTQDIEKATDDPRNIIFTHGRSDAIALKLVTRDEAEKIAQYQKTQEGGRNVIT